jgi:hypothetical protein
LNLSNASLGSDLVLRGWDEICVCVCACGGGGGGGGGGVYLEPPDSGPFDNFMSAAAGPKRWDVSRQAKGRGFDPTRVVLFTLLT